MTAARFRLGGSRTLCAIAVALLGTWAMPIQAAPYRVTGTGFVTDDGHPKHPGDFTRYDVTVRVTFDPVPGSATASHGS